MGNLPFWMFLLTTATLLLLCVFHKSSYTDLLTHFQCFTSFSYKIGLIKCLIDSTSSPIKLGQNRRVVYKARFWATCHVTHSKYSHWLKQYTPRRESPRVDIVPNVGVDIVDIFEAFSLAKNNIPPAESSPERISYRIWGGYYTTCGERATEREWIPWRASNRAWVDPMESGFLIYTWQIYKYINRRFF